MEILVLGGTRYFGVHLVQQLLSDGHNVTIATRGKTKDSFGSTVKRVTVERTSPQSLAQGLAGKNYDVIYDNLAYCSNDVKALFDSVRCGRYIMTSSASVYDLHKNTRECDFNPLEKSLVWCNRNEFPYDEVKRQAECALFQRYSDRNVVAVRYPFVVGEDDYTNRLYFYVEHIVRGIPMYIDNPDVRMSFIHSSEAGHFLAFLAESTYTGVINGASTGTVSLKEVLKYVEGKVGKKAILHREGEAAPYNGTMDYSINNELALELGFPFSHIEEWIYPLLDSYISRAVM